jgi:hypothetical protein
MGPAGPSQGMWSSVSYAVRLRSDRLNTDRCSYRPSERPADDLNRAVAVGGTVIFIPASAPHHDPDNRAASGRTIMNDQPIGTPPGTSIDRYPFDPNGSLVMSETLRRRRKDCSTGRTP